MILTWTKSNKKINICVLCPCPVCLYVLYYPGDVSIMSLYIVLVVDICPDMGRRNKQGILFGLEGLRASAIVAGHC